ncbi:hypothetical protein BV392_04495 [Rhodovulum sulfidophilum]|nr:hypothetical protein BV392_04495 [Rhodovulum sulfidophilum]
MLSRLERLAVSENTAAQMLDLPRARFRDLVHKGVLPPPIELAPGLERWRASELRAVLDGQVPRERFEW